MPEIKGGEEVGSGLERHPPVLCEEPREQGWASEGPGPVSPCALTPPGSTSWRSGGDPSTACYSCTRTRRCCCPPSTTRATPTCPSASSTCWTTSSHRRPCTTSTRSTWSTCRATGSASGCAPSASAPASSWPRRRSSCARRCTCSASGPSP